MKSYIADGYTESGYIAEKPGIYEAVRFKYRRMLHHALARVRDKMNVSGFDGAKAVYPELAAHLTEWDIKEHDKDGNEVGVLKLNKESISRLAPQLVEKLFNIIAGYSPNDVDEAAKGTTKDDFELFLEQSAESDAKN